MIDELQLLGWNIRKVAEPVPHGHGAILLSQRFKPVVHGQLLTVGHLEEHLVVVDPSAMRLKRWSARVVDDAQFDLGPPHTSTCC